MLEKIPFGQTPEQAKEAENVLRGSALELVEQEEEQESGQVYSTKSREIKSIDEAYGFTKEELALAEDKLNKSELKDATLEDKDD